jgi:hypothetical protein
MGSDVCSRKTPIAPRRLAADFAGWERNNRWFEEQVEQRGESAAERAHGNRLPSPGFSKLMKNSPLIGHLGNNRMNITGKWN